MGYPGDHDQSGGRRPAAPASQDEPYGASDPHAFPWTPLWQQGSSGDPRNASGPGSPVPGGESGGGDPYAAEHGWGGMSYPQENARAARSGPEPTAPAPGTGDPFSFQPNPYDGPHGPGPAADPYAEFGAPAAPPSSQPFQPGHDPGGYGPHLGGPDDYGPGGGGEYGPGGDGEYGGSGRSKVPLIVGVAVGAVVLVGGGAYAFSALGGGPGTPAPAAVTPTQSAVAPSSPGVAASPSINPSAPLHLMLKSRTTDPQPLTVGEIFKNQQFGKYAMAGSSEDADCAKDVHGAKLVGALKAGHCTQLLRATYATTDGKLIGTIGVANLTTEAAAKAAAKAGAGKDAWLVPLAGDTSATKKIGGKAIAQGTAEANGHYLILSWIQRPDGKDFAPAQKKAISDFVTQVPLGSNLDTALAYRGISGKPDGS